MQSQTKQAQTEALNKGPNSPSARLASLSEGNAAARLRALFKLTNDRLKPKVAALFADLGEARPTSLLYHSKAVSDVEAIQVRQDLFDSLLASVIEQGQASAGVYGPQGHRTVVLVVPLTRQTPNGTDSFGGLALCFEEFPQSEMATKLQLLESWSALAAAESCSTEAKAQTQHTEAENDSVERLSKALAMSSAKEVAYQIVNSLATKYQCEQVLIGLMHRGRVRPLATSGAADVKSNSPGIVLASKAMIECCDNDCPVAFPAIQGGDPTTASLLHAKWSHSTASSHTYSVPLKCNGSIVGVASLRRSQSLPFSVETAKELGERLEPFGPAFSTLRKAERGLASHVVESSKQVLNPKVSNAFKLFMLTILLAGAVWFFSGTSIYKPTCNAELATQNLREVACPIEGVLSKVHVREGELVRKGQKLVEFEADKLLLEERVLLSQLQEAEARMGEVLTQHDPNALAIEQAKLNVLKSKLASTRQRLEQTVISSPVDGMITRADLATKIGQPFRFGDTLIEVADTSAWKVRINVPDRIVSDIRTGMQGTFTPLGRPHEQFQVQLSCLRGTSEQIDGSNVFVAEALLDEKKEWMRTGMKGLAKIESDAKPVYWIWFRDAIDWFYLQLWL